MAECEWIVLCDHAFPDFRGKLCLIGIFDVINAAQVPAAHDRASVGFSIIGEPGERVQLKLDIIGPLGQTLTTATPPEFTLPDDGAARGQIEVRHLVLADWGRYAIQIDVGDGSPKTAWFTLRQIHQTP